MADTSAVSTETALAHRHTLHTTDSSPPSSATIITSTTTEPASTSTATATTSDTRDNTALPISNPPFSISMNPISARTTPPTTTTTAPAPAPAPATTSSRSKTKLSTTTPGPGTGRAKRSKHGCRTCRRRRKKCDETRPTCLGCQKLGIECEGYERPLIWGNGIASRGRLKGATVPTMDMWKPGGGSNGGTGVKRKANGSKNGEGAVRKSPRADDAKGPGAQDSTNPVAAAVEIKIACSAGEGGDRGRGSETLAGTTTIATKAGGSVASVAMPIVSAISPAAMGAPLTQTAKVDEVERRESMQSVQSMPSIHSTSTLPSHHGSPGIRISEITKLPHHPRSMIPTTGMSSFALTASTSASTSTPASAPHNLTGEQPSNAFLNVPSPDVPPRSEVESPKATSVITSASSPRIDDVDVFSQDDEPLDQELYNRLVLEFFTSGHLTLYSTNKHDSPVLDTVLPLARESLTLRSVCASYQALLAEVPMSQFQAIYSSALQQYRADLGNKIIREKDSTICAGLLLCTIGASQHLPFTFHIQPVLKLLTMRTSLSWNPFHAHAFEVMGYYDLPSFIVNRRAPRLDIWQTYCMHDTDRSEIEPVSGLPRSLLDIFAKMEEADCEERFWYWYGREGSVMQVHLWDAHRFAGMLKHREVKNDYRRKMRESGLDNAIFETENPKLPPSGVILNRLVACLSVMFRCHRHPDGKDPHLIMNSIFYPLFIAGCQVVRLETPRPDWEEIIKDIFEICSELKMQVEPMQRIIEVMRWKPGMSPDQIAADMGMEIALV